MVPYTESVSLAATVGEPQARLFLAGSLAHVDPGPAALGDFLTLWRLAYLILTERDR